MRRSAERLALFFIITQVDRVAGYIHLFQPADTLFYYLLSYGIAIGLAYGVYTSFFYVRQPKVKWASISGIILFGGFDLLFNELALIRTASMKTLISSTSSFVWIDAEYLQVAIQASVIAYGILPTLASAVLGWMQGGADKVTDAEFGRITVWMRMGKAVSKIFDSLALQFAFRIEGIGSKLSRLDNDSPQEVTPINAEFTQSATPKRWNDLSREDVVFVQVAGRKAIQAKYGISNGSAGNWKASVKSGVMPWDDVKKLTENA